MSDQPMRTPGSGRKRQVENGSSRRSSSADNSYDHHPGTARYRPRQARVARGLSGLRRRKTISQVPPPPPLRPLAPPSLQQTVTRHAPEDRRAHEAFLMSATTFTTPRHQPRQKNSSVTAAALPPGAPRKFRRGIMGRFCIGAKARGRKQASQVRLFFCYPPKEAKRSKEKGGHFFPRGKREKPLPAGRGARSPRSRFIGDRKGAQSAPATRVYEYKRHAKRLNCE
jgi:hypothetical protein